MANIENMLRQLSNENTARTFAFNASEAQKSRDFSESMSNTSHQREVEDLKRAGLNPVLSSNGGAQAYSASSASGSADNSAVGVLASIYQTKMNNDNAVKLAKLQNANNVQIAKINAAASNYASNNAYAASAYNTDVSSRTSLKNSARNYKATDAGIIDSLGFGSKGNKFAKGSYLVSKTFGNGALSLLGQYFRHGKK